LFFDIALLKQYSAHFHKRSHDGNIHPDGFITVQDTAEHGYSLLRKAYGRYRVPPPPVFEVSN
jgi:hypothetical protein